MTGTEGEQPALFYPHTTHWRWTSRDAWEEEIAELSRRLTGAVPGTRVGFRWRPRPLALTRDRALLRAGLVSAPVEDRVPEGLDRWLGEEAPEDLPSLETGDPTTGGAPAGEGRALVRDDAGAAREWGTEQRHAAAAALRVALGPLRAQRSLAFVSGCPADRVERAFVEWSLNQ